MPETLHMPAGSEFRVMSSASDPERDPCEIEFTVMSRGAAPPPHIHPRQSETFTVIEGDSFELRLPGYKPLAPGESHTVAAGTSHTYRNLGDGPVRVRAVHDPGLSFERYVRRLVATTQQLGVVRVSPGMLVCMSRLWHEHADTIRPASPAVQAVMTVLRNVGRVTGPRPAP